MNEANKNLNILVVAHSSGVGGAETALMNLIENLISANHRCTIVFPSNQGESVNHFLHKGVECLAMPMPWCCPTPHVGFASLVSMGSENVLTLLARKKFDLVLTNTLMVFHGAYLARLMEIPHIAYAHELLGSDIDFRTKCIPSEEYLNLLEEYSDHIFCCSGAVQDQFKDRDKTSILNPFAIDQAPKRYTSKNYQTIDLLVIGAQNRRKNQAFAITVLQALRLRGYDCSLHFMGQQGSETNKVHALVKKRDLSMYVHLHGHVEDPYSIVNGKCINLICSTSEPFGLTIPEAFSRGIPVVSTKSGGPELLIEQRYLYRIGDLNHCVRILESIMGNYEQEQLEAERQFQKIADGLDKVRQVKTINFALRKVKANYKPKEYSRYFDSIFRDSIYLATLTEKEIVENISFVTNKAIEQIDRLLQHEKKHPGSTVLEDIRQYDVVPFAYSENMDQLYKSGFGFAIELAATCKDHSRLLMSSYILSRLIYESRSRKINVLAIGDGIGADTIRIATAGFDVDYVDYDASLTSKVAARNFQTFKDKEVIGSGQIRVIHETDSHTKYDAVICLEVIEHVKNPANFLENISGRLEVNGLLFISECFDGIKDMWPTHLYESEDFSGLLPLMSTNCLELVDYNISPLFKLYLFRKVDSHKQQNLAELLKRDRILTTEIIGAQLQIGV